MARLGNGRARLCWMCVCVCIYIIRSIQAAAGPRGSSPASSLCRRPFADVERKSSFKLRETMVFKVAKDRGPSSSARPASTSLVLLRTSQPASKFSLCYIYLVLRFAGYLPDRFSYCRARHNTNCLYTSPLISRTSVLPVPIHYRVNITTQTL